MYIIAFVVVLALMCVCVSVCAGARFIKHSIDFRLPCLWLLVAVGVVYCVMQALIEEFSPELTSKVGKLDSDPHLWMPVSNVKIAANNAGDTLDKEGTRRSLRNKSPWGGGGWSFIAPPVCCSLRSSNFVVQYHSRPCCCCCCLAAVAVVAVYAVFVVDVDFGSSPSRNLRTWRSWAARGRLPRKRWRTTRG